MNNCDCPKEGSAFFSTTSLHIDIYLSLSHEKLLPEKNMFELLKIGHVEQQYQDT